MLTPLMATAHDVAAHILSQSSPMSAMKLQKLVYYSQAWHLAWEDAPLPATAANTSWRRGTATRHGKTRPLRAQPRAGDRRERERRNAPRLPHRYAVKASAAAPRSERPRRRRLRRRVPYQQRRACLGTAVQGRLPHALVGSEPR